MPDDDGSPSDSAPQDRPAPLTRQEIKRFVNGVAIFFLATVAAMWAGGMYLIVTHFTR